MRVIATAVGFFDNLRQPGDEFEVPEGAKGSWFKPVKVADDPEAKPGRSRKASPDPADDLV